MVGKLLLYSEVSAPVEERKLKDASTFLYKSEFCSITAQIVVDNLPMRLEGQTPRVSMCLGRRWHLSVAEHPCYRL